ncbi:hypothetical protein A2U01_0071837, partial [Trifolium medium]|nr:hypothetical protein [Trifolium medium]
VLNDEKGCSASDLEKLRTRNEKLEAKVVKDKNALSDYQEKYRIYVEQVTELQETKVELEKLQKKMEELKVNSTEEKKKLKDEVDALKSAMAPIADEPEAA